MQGGKSAMAYQYTLILLQNKKAQTYKAGNRIQIPSHTAVCIPSSKKYFSKQPLRVF